MFLGKKRYNFAFFIFKLKGLSKSICFKLQRFDQNDDNFSQMRVDVYEYFLIVYLKYNKGFLELKFKYVNINKRLSLHFVIDILKRFIAWIWSVMQQNPFIIQVPYLTTDPETFIRNGE